MNFVKMQGQGVKKKIKKLTVRVKTISVVPNVI